jgi:hypothetical protein
MNWPALWKEAGIDPESEKAELLKALIMFMEEAHFKRIVTGSYGRMLDPMDNGLNVVESITGLSWPRIQEILRNE